MNVVVMSRSKFTINLKNLKIQGSTVRQLYKFALSLVNFESGSEKILINENNMTSGLILLWRSAKENASPTLQILR